jgi:hypothetical protein
MRPGLAAEAAEARDVSRNRKDSFKARDQVTLTLEPVKNGRPLGRILFQSSELADVLTERYFCSASREMR